MDRSERPSTAGRPRTATTCKTDGNWISAVLEGRGVGHEVGIASLELDTKLCYITQLTDSQTFVKTIHTLTSKRYPSTILVPSTAAKPGQNPDVQQMNLTSGHIFMECLSESFEDVPFTPVARKYWNEQAGLDFIVQYGTNDETSKATAKTAESKYYALSATSALFKYVELTLSIIYPANSLNIKYAALEGTALIDIDTVISLELVANLVDPTSKQSLLGLLDHCYTPMGSRLLRANILCPSTSEETINARLDVVEELIETDQRFLAIRKCLATLKKIDLDKLIGSMITGRVPSPVLRAKSDPATLAGQKIQRFVNLKGILRVLPLLVQSLDNCRSNLLVMMKTIFQHERIGQMIQKIDDVLSDSVDSVASRQCIAKDKKIRAIRPKKNLLLDVARETYIENVMDCEELAQKLSDKHGFDIQLQYFQNGYRLVANNEDIEKAGKLGKMGFNSISKKAKKTYFSCLDLKKKNHKIIDSLQEIFLLSDQTLETLNEKISEDISALYRCSEAVALLDMLTAFADVASKYEYTRPEFTGTLAIKGGRHPLVERREDSNFVANDTWVTESSTFQIITGPNMSGKSTFIRQIALLSIMAQIGSFVPAEYASFIIIFSILSRLSNDDSIEAGLSTFATEMKSMSLILSALEVCKEDGNMLIIVDELGRGTSSAEGIGIAHAIAEKIIESKAICFFITHFRELCTTLHAYPTVVTLQMACEVDAYCAPTNCGLRFLHTIRNGASEHVHYGIELARGTSLPPSVIDRAIDVARQLDELAIEDQRTSKSIMVIERRREVLNLVASLKHIYRECSPTTSYSQIKSMLMRLQKRAVNELEKYLEEESFAES